MDASDYKRLRFNLRIKWFVAQIISLIFWQKYNIQIDMAGEDLVLLD